MGDPYRPSNYHQSTYQPSTYAPPASDQYDPRDHYASGALTTRHNSSGNTYYPQSNTQLTQSSYRPNSSDSKYLDPADSHRTHRSHSHSRHNSRDDDDDRRKRSKSRTKEWGSTAVGAAAGGLIGNELGHGPLATIGGLVAGAYGAHELEKRHERHKEKKRLSGGGDDGRSSRGSGHHKRRSSGGLLDNVKDKVEGFLSNPDADVGKKRRSRSHVGTGGGRNSKTRDYDSYSDGEDDGYSRRSSRGGGKSRRDDYY